MSFARLAAPDAASRCPMCPLMEVRWRGFAEVLSLEKMVRMLCSSVGSPARVPVAED